LTDEETLPDDKERVIRNYILEHPGVTANTVATYMVNQGLLSKVPTLKRIKGLITRGIIDDRKKGNSFHRLYVTDKTQFNTIYREVLEVSAIMEDMLELSERYQHLAKVKVIPTTTAGTDPGVNPRFISLEFDSKAYVDTVSAMLRILLVWTHISKINDADKNLLYQKITNAFIRLNREPYNLPSSKKVLSLNKIRLQLKMQQLTGARNSQNIKNIARLLKKADDFDTIIADIQKLLNTV
jgi:hypothetical protein